MLALAGALPAGVKRSVCAMGHKWLWNPKWGGFPPEEFLVSLDPLMVGIRAKLDGEYLTSNHIAGHLSPEWAAKLGVEFILDGSVQSGDHGLHVTIHLDHVLTHATVWTASYDQNGLAASEFQAKIAAKAASVAGNAIQARRDDPAEMDDAALGLQLKMAGSDWTNTQADFLEQRDLNRALIARAPKYATAYLALSQISSEMMKFASPDEIPQLRAETSTPRKMLPPPTTMPSSTPSSRAATSSPATRSTVG